MLLLISPAKTFAKVKKGYDTSSVGLLFPEQTAEICQGMLKLSSEYLGKGLNLKPNSAQKAYQQWRQFADEATPSTPALQLYSGMVFKKIGANTLDAPALRFLEEHLLICSFAYGLLRPSIGIKPYRLEGGLEPLWSAGVSVFHYWREVLTEYLIRAAQERGGVLCFLASEEMKQLFHWERVEAAVRVVTPRFVVETPEGSTKQIVVYTKMARGAMVRSIAEQCIEDPDMLKTLTPEGYIYQAALSDDNTWCYVLKN